MAVHIFTIGQGKRYQFAMREDGVWFKRSKDHRNMWGKWLPTGSKNRPDAIWYHPGAGRANLPKE